MSKCLGNINTFCYICGKFVVSHNRKPLSERVEHAYSFYFSKTIAKRPWTPNICCATCYCGLANWMNGKRAMMPFGIPMEWMDPGPAHDSATCYMCVNNATRHNVRQLRQFVYKNVPTATLPRPHSHEVPVPKRPSPLTAQIFTAEDLELPDAPSIPVPSAGSSSWMEVAPRAPILLDEEHLHSIARNLSLSKTKAESLAAELHKYNLLAPGVSVTSFRLRNSRFKAFFIPNEANDFVYCNNIQGLMYTMNIAKYDAEEWRLFIDSSQTSLKGMNEREEK